MHSCASSFSLPELKCFSQLSDLFFRDSSLYLSPVQQINLSVFFHRLYQTYCIFKRLSCRKNSMIWPEHHPVLLHFLCRGWSDFSFSAHHPREHAEPFRKHKHTLRVQTPHGFRKCLLFCLMGKGHRDSVGRVTVHDQFIVCIGL